MWNYGLFGELPEKRCEGIPKLREPASAGQHISGFDVAVHKMGDSFRPERNDDSPGGRIQSARQVTIVFCEGEGSFHRFG